MQPYHFETFGPKHLLYLAGTLVVWVVVLRFGRGAEQRVRRRAAWGLVALSLGQELTWDVVGISRGIYDVAEHLPLHLCSLALLVGSYAVVTRRQLAFETAYFWAVVAATQALLTPDPGRWAMGEWDAFWNFLSHGAIILNVLWLVFVEGMRLRPRAWLRTFGLTNAVAVVIGVFDWATGFNYFYLRWKPGGDSPFLVGDWPWYIVGLELLALVFFFLAHLGLRLAGTPHEPRAVVDHLALPEGSAG